MRDLLAGALMLIVLVGALLVVGALQLRPVPEDLAPGRSTEPQLEERIVTDDFHRDRYLQGCYTTLEGC